MKTDTIEKQGKKPAKQLRRIAIVTAVIVVAGVLVFSLGIFKSPDNSDTSLGTYTVTRGDLTISVTEAGDIKAIDSHDIQSEVEGRTTIISIVDEGIDITPEDVNNGKVLVELDSSEIKQRLTQQEITFLSVEASYAEAKESLDIQKKQNESDIEAGRMKVRFGLMDFRKYLSQTVAEQFMNKAEQDPNFNADTDVAILLEHPKLGGAASQKLKELEDEIVLAESKFQQASDSLMWTKKLYDKQYVAETKLREDQLAVQSNKIRMEKAKLALELFKLYEFPKEAEKLFSDYGEAKREAERIEARARSKLTQAEAKLRSTEAKYSLEKERLENWQKQFEACTIKAPVPGQVVYSSSMGDRWMRRNNPIEVGAEVRERQKIISIPDTSEMKVEVKIHETWVDKIQPGQQAKITITAFPDKTFTGKVLKKAPLADPEEWLNPDLKVYTTDVSIDGTHDFLKTGMTAKVEVIIEQLKDVINVPVQTVVNRNGKKVCYVVTDKGPQQREVETGSFNDNFVEIKSGLDEGEKVLLNPPRMSKPQAADKKTKKQATLQQNR